MLIGVISDTHGRLDPRVVELFRPVEHIVHAGDIGDESVVRGLRDLAPVDCVRGNNDRTGEVARYPLTRVAYVAGHRLLLRHQVSLPQREDDPFLVDCRAAGVTAVIFGHSHMPLAATRDGMLFFNPGSAGPRRFKSVPSAGLLRLRPDYIDSEIILL
jgi:putative phosphoesterase